MIHVGDCLDVMKTLPGESIDAIVTDPPYGLSFMGKDWDHGIPGEPFWREALRVTKPGTHLLAFGGTRTFHRLTCAIEDAGWEIRDCIMWVYGSGFPKSHNLKDEWQGWGTALKPAWEPIIVARKPLAGTVAENVLRYGTGAVNVDGCRAKPTGESRERVCEASQERRYTDEGGTNFAAKPGVRGGATAGRWPANLIHDGSDEVVGLFNISADPLSVRGHDHHGLIAGGDPNKSPARFFYVPKASKKDRDEGCEGLEERPSQKMGDGLKSMVGHPSGNNGNTSTEDRKARNHHPTVKPTALMRHLCRLVTPPNGMVLDPFCGSGSTGKAATLEGFRFVGIELNPEYAEIARARIAAVQADIPLLEAVS